MKLERTEKPRIAVVIAARNVARWINECLESVLSQSLQAAEVVYVDDGSDDESAVMAEAWQAQFPERLRVMRLAESHWMAEARNAGVRATSAPLVLCWDGDDVMPKDFLRDMHAALRTGDAFSYCGRLFFGEATGFKPAPAWDRRTLWDHNFVPSPMLMRRHDFEAVGGWVEPPVRAMPDWHLALRLSARGTASPSCALAGVRKHGGNHSDGWKRNKKAVLGQVRRHAASLTVGMVYGGRLPELMPSWLEAVARSLQDACKTAELLVLDASEEGFRMRGESAVVREVFSAVHLRRMPHAPKLAHVARDGPEVKRLLATHLAGACNDLLRLASGDVLWMLEDDMIVPTHACRVLLRELVGGCKPRAAVSGVYRSRRAPERIVAQCLRGEGAPSLTECPAEAMEVDLAGTGCLMLLRDLAMERARFNANFRNAWCHDSAFSGALAERGGKVLLVPEVQVRHYQTMEESV